MISIKNRLDCHLFMSFLFVFFLDVQHAFAKELKDVRAEEKGMVTMECETRKPPKTVTWFKGLMVLSSGQKYLLKKKDVVLSLTIYNLDKSDSAVYTCDVGTMQSRALLTIQGKKATFIAIYL